MLVKNIEKYNMTILGLIIKLISKKLALIKINIEHLEIL